MISKIIEIVNEKLGQRKYGAHPLKKEYINKVEAYPLSIRSFLLEPEVLKALFGEKPLLICPACDAEEVEEINISGEEPFYCGYCGYTFIDIKKANIYHGIKLFCIEEEKEMVKYIELNLSEV